jgi:hypothetical protein
LDVALSTCTHLKRILVMLAGHVVRMEEHRIPKKELGSCFGGGRPVGGNEIDGKMPYRGMQPTCSGFGTGRLKQEIRRSGGRRLERPWPENEPKRHIKRNSLHMQRPGVIWSLMFLSVILSCIGLF